MDKNNEFIFLIKQQKRWIGFFALGDLFFNRGTATRASLTLSSGSGVFCAACGPGLGRRGEPAARGSRILRQRGGFRVGPGRFRAVPGRAGRPCAPRGCRRLLWGRAAAGGSGRAREPARADSLCLVATVRPRYPGAPAAPRVFLILNTIKNNETSNFQDP